MPIRGAKLWSGAAATVVLLSCAGLLAAPAEIGPGLLDAANLALLPPETNGLMGIDVERLKVTSLYRFLEEQWRGKEPAASSDIDEWAALSGFDPRRDLSEILVVSWQTPDQKLQPGQALPLLALARGRFDATKLGKQFVAKGATEENYRGARVFLFPQDRPKAPLPDPGETIVIPPPAPEALPQVAIAFVEDGLGLVGGYDAIAAALDRRSQAATPAATLEPLLKRGRELREGHQIWAVSEQPGGLLKPGMAGTKADTKLIEILQSMSESTFAIDLEDGFRGRLAALCGVADDAKLLGDLARGFLAMARFSNGAGAPLAPMLEHVKVTEEGAKFEVSVDIDGAQLNTYLETLKAARTPAR